MQGRLLPKYKGRYQAHPVGYWQDEFVIAAQLNLDLIEWILDFNEADQNPMMSDRGIQEIQNVVSRTGVGVQTICADYFMEAPLHSDKASVAAKSKEVLLGLLQRCPSLGVTNIVIPCVDQSRISSEAEIQRFVSVMRDVAPVAVKAQIFLSLETDLAPVPFKNLLSTIDSPAISVNYDTGNSASLGFDPKEELAAYGPRITDIHIKDRKLGGGSVVLGSGDTQFAAFFESLKPLHYDGPFIMQAYRDDEGLDIFRSQLQWAKTELKRQGYLN